MSPSPKPITQSGQARAGQGKIGLGLAGLGLLSPAWHNTSLRTSMASSRRSKVKNKNDFPSQATAMAVASQTPKVPKVSLQKKMDENTPDTSPTSRAAQRGQDPHIVQTKGMQVKAQEERSQAAKVRREEQEAQRAKGMAEVEAMRQAINAKYKRLAELQDEKDVKMRTDVEEAQWGADDQTDSAMEVDAANCDDAGQKVRANNFLLLRRMCSLRTMRTKEPKTAKLTEKEKKDARMNWTCVARLALTASQPPSCP